MPGPMRRNAPFLLFLTVLAAGSIWMIRPIPGEAAPLPPPPKAPPVMIPVVERPVLELVRVTEADIAKLRVELQSAETEVRDKKASLAASDTDLSALQKKVDALRAELQALEAKLAELLARAKHQAVAADDALEEKVEEQREQAVKLESDLASLRAQSLTPDERRRLRTAVTPMWRLPVLVDLIGNTIAPVDKDFFRFPMLELSSRFVVKRKRPGETIAEARKPDSMFHEFLADVRKQRGYVSCLLNSDSFEAFHAVREMATRAGVDVSWDPADTRDGNVTIERVHLVNKLSKKDRPVSLPDIVR